MAIATAARLAARGYLIKGEVLEKWFEVQKARVAFEEGVEIAKESGDPEVVKEADGWNWLSPSAPR